MSDTDVQQDFAKILFRTPTANELSSWGAYETLQGSNTALAQAIANTNEAQNFVLPIVRLYEACLGRSGVDADGGTSGLSFWIAKAEAGANTASGSISASVLLNLAQSFLSSSEFQTRYGSATPNPTAFITLLYQNVFGRLPDVGGQQYWINFLNAQGNSTAAYAQVLVNFANSAEYVAASNSGISAWLASAGAAGSYGTLVVGATGTTYQLTAGIDTVPGTSGNDTIIVNTTDATPAIGLTTLDSIDGGAGYDTLSVTFDGAVDLTGITGLTVKNVEAVKVVSTGAVTLDTNAWVGVQAVNVAASVGNDVVKVGTSTDVTVSDSGTTASVVVDGGKNVTVTNAGTGGVFVGYSDTTTTDVKVTGAVNVTSAGDVGVNGGTSVTVNAAGAVTIAAATGAISVVDTATAAKNVVITGGTTVSVTTTTANTGNITIGATSNDVATGETHSVVALGSINVDVETTTASGAKRIGGVAGIETGNVTINNSTTDGNGNVTYGTATVAALLNGATTYTQTGGTGTVADAAVAIGGTSHLTSAVLTGVGTTGIYSDALTSISLAKSTATVTANVTGAHALAITSSGNSGAATVADATATSFTVNSSGANASATDTLILSGAKAASVAVTNATGAFTLGSLAAVGTDASVTTLALSASGSGSINLGDVSALAKVKAVDASGTTGSVAIKIDGTHTSYTGGSGSDTVTLEVGSPLKAISGGAGNDVLVIDMAATAYTIPTYLNSMITGFETLGLGAAATGSYDATGFATLQAGAVTGASTFTNVANNATLNVLAAPTQNLTLTLADATGNSDVANLTFGTSTQTGTDFTSGTTKVVSVAGVETLNITSNGSSTQTLANTISVTDAAVKTLVVLGGHDVVLTTGGSALTTINASGATGAVDLHLVTVSASGATITGGSGLLTAVGGAGVDTIISGSGGATITGGIGADVINLAASAAKADTLVVANGDSLYNSFDSVSGFNAAATNADKIDFAGTATVAVDAAAGQTTGVAGVTYGITSGILTFAGPSLGATTLAQLITAAEAVVDATANSTVAFVYGSDTYVVHAASGATQDTTTDSVIKLVGVTDATAVGTAAAAHTIVIA